MSGRNLPEKAVLKRTSLALKDRVALIKSFEERGKSQRQLAVEFGVGKTQVQDALKRKAEFMAAYEQNASNDMKRLRSFGTLEIDSMTWA